MILCDIGNTNIHFYQNGTLWRELSSIKNLPNKEEKFYYISVNKKLSEYLSKIINAINLEPFFNLDTIYDGLGVDRTAACKAVDNGMIVDAGSAITVDIMANGVHLGGYIMPGLFALQKSFADISAKLDIKINPNIALDILPQNSSEAVSYGAIKPIFLILQESKKDKKIYFTGGDGKFFAKFFDNSIYDNSLVFRGMLKVIREKGIKC